MLDRINPDAIQPNGSAARGVNNIAHMSIDSGPFGFIDPAKNYPMTNGSWHECKGALLTSVQTCSGNANRSFYRTLIFNHLRAEEGEAKGKIWAKVGFFLLCCTSSCFELFQAVFKLAQTAGHFVKILEMHMNTLEIADWNGRSTNEQLSLFFDVRSNS